MVEDDTAFRPATFDGTVEELSELGNSVWSEHYAGSMRIDLFSPAFLKATQACSEWLAVAARDREGALASFAIVLGHEGRLFGRPVQMAVGSWLTTSKAHARKGLALKVYQEGFRLLRERGYQVAASLSDTGSKSLAMMQQHSVEAQGVVGPFVLPARLPWAGVLGKTALLAMRLPLVDRTILRGLGRAGSPRCPAGVAVRDCAEEELAPAEALLEQAPLDLQTVYTPALQRANLAAPPFFRTLRVERHGELIGLVHVLDLPMLGEAPIGCVAFERTWFREGMRRDALAGAVAHVAAEGKGLVIAPNVDTWAERRALLSVGLLPDVARPLRTCLWALDPACADELRRVRTAFVPFR